MANSHKKLWTFQIDKDTNKSKLSKASCLHEMPKTCLNLGANIGKDISLQFCQCFKRDEHATLIVPEAQK